jgi:hypothetical protein
MMSWRGVQGGIWLTRGLWLLAAALPLCAAALVGYWRLGELLSAPKPLEMPSLGKIPAPATSGPAIAERNPFDPAGIAWRVPTAEKQMVAQLGDVRGVLAASDGGRVFTAGGMLKAGDSFAGGTLETVTGDVLFVRMPDGNEKRMDLAHKDDKLRERILELMGARAKR